MATRFWARHGTGVDPRALGLGLWLIGWVDITEERYDHAVTCGDECVRVALTCLDRSVGMQVKGLAFALTGKLEEGVAILRTSITALSWSSDGRFASYVSVGRPTRTEINGVPA